MNQAQLLEIALKAAKAAGEKVLSYYQNQNFEALQKSDDSPVTSADFAANDILVDMLTALTPDIPIVSEESNFLPLSKRKNWHRYWLLDPIDGTGEFIIGSGDFAVNIALIENNWPAIGVIHAPARKITYFASKEGGTFKEEAGKTIPIKVAEYDGKRPIKVAVSRRQKIELMHQYLSPDFDYELVPLGSCSLKSCLIAEGGADCYLRIGPTGEWDTGASHCVVEVGGGEILDSEFNPLSYNQRESLLNPDFITLGNRDIPWHLIISKHKRG